MKERNYFLFLEITAAVPDTASTESITAAGILPVVGEVVVVVSAAGVEVSAEVVSAAAPAPIPETVNVISTESLGIV